MIIPPNMTEAQVVDAMERVVRLLAKNFRFGYHEVDDMKQQGILFAIKGMEKYDPSRPLENFLYKHIRNRFINFKRDNFKRTDYPCKICHEADVNGLTTHSDGELCEAYARWATRNISRQNIMNFIDICNISDENEPNTRREDNVVYDAQESELIELVENKLPIELRSYWLQMRHGASVPKAKRLEVESAVREIVQIGASEHAAY